MSCYIAVCARFFSIHMLTSLPRARSRARARDAKPHLQIPYLFCNCISCANPDRVHVGRKMDTNDTILNKSRMTFSHAVDLGKSEADSHLDKPVMTDSQMQNHICKIHIVLQRDISTESLMQSHTCKSRICFAIAYFVPILTECTSDGKLIQTIRYLINHV